MSTRSNQKTDALSVSRFDIDLIRHWAYPVALAVVLTTWALYMAISDSWHLFGEFWEASLTMTLGSFVAGATAEGGAAIAFPVFTKVLHIEPETARTFGLMIQSVGMTMAALVIWTRKIPVLWRVIMWTSLGGIAGQLIGGFWISIGSPNSKILFTFVASIFGAAVVVSRWGFKLPTIDRLPTWRTNDRVFYTFIGVIGGVFAANTGSGIDMVTFIVLTLAIGINEKISTPTTVVIMGINSVVGFAVQGLLVNGVGDAMDYWLVAVPVVVFGAPLGAYAASKATRDHIIILLVSLITIELVTTLLLVPFSPAATRLAVMSVAVSIVWFIAMLTYRVKHIVPAMKTLAAVAARDDAIAKESGSLQVELAAAERATDVADVRDQGKHELGDQ